VASAGTSTVTVLRTFLRFLQAGAVELAAAFVLEVVTFWAVVAVGPWPVNKHLQLFES